MAVKLNKTRIRDSKIILIGTLLAHALSTGPFPYGGAVHELFEIAGYVLISLCVVGRVYATAFLGGFKNEKLITDGPFSIVRNPLYMFSLIGVLGIGVMSNHLLIMLGLPVVFVLMYHFLIRREEAFLQEKFGAEYAAYCKAVPRLFPNFRLYHAQDTVPMAPRYLNKALADSVWWLAIFPLLEIIDLLQNSGLIHPIFVMP